MEQKGKPSPLSINGISIDYFSQIMYNIKIPMTNTEKLVTIHTLPNSKPEKYEEVMDHGRFVADLEGQGLTPVITNRQSFNSGEILRPRLDESGRLTFREETIALDGLRSAAAMHNRVLSSLTAPEAALIPKLNDNAIKDYARSKYRLYEDILHDYQAPTSFLAIEQDGFTDIAAALESIETQHVVLKSDSGTGGKSMEKVERTEVASWAAHLLEQGKAGAYILQPDIAFGKIPAGIQGVGESARNLITRARRDNLLSELRMLTVKNGSSYDFVPIMRVVTEEGERMGSASDVYVDIDVPDELESQLRDVSRTVVEEAAAKAGGISQVLAAADYYFTDDGQPRIMELNLRSPQIPRSRVNPVAGRRIHEVVANSLAAMSHKE